MDSRSLGCRSVGHSRSVVTHTSQRCAGVPRSMAPSSVATESSTMSPCCGYFGLFAWLLKDAFQLTAGGSSEATGPCYSKSSEGQCLFATRLFEAGDVLESADR
jgi:hypothetical protein